MRVGDQLKKTMHLRRLIGIASLALSLSVAAGLAGAATSDSETLVVLAKTSVKWDPVDCPAGMSAALSCYLFAGDALVPGLGRVSVRYTRAFDGDFTKPCPRTLPHATLEVAGKGQIELEIVGPECALLPPSRFVFGAVITGGSGLYGGASGTLSVDSRHWEAGGGHGHGADVWTGTLHVAGFDFDVTPPVIAGAISKTVRVPKNGARVRVRYTVTAQDAVAGSVSAPCWPRSGAFFKVGRTSVMCSAVDSSGNTRLARFTITVKR